MVNWPVHPPCASLGPAWICILHSLQLVLITYYYVKTNTKVQTKTKAFTRSCISKTCDELRKTSIFGSVFVLAHKQAIGKVAVLPRVRWCYDDDTRDVIFGYSTVEYLHFEKFAHFSKEIPSKKMQHWRTLETLCHLILLSRLPPAR